MKKDMNPKAIAGIVIAGAVVSGVTYWLLKSRPKPQDYAMLFSDLKYLQNQYGITDAGVGGEFNSEQELYNDINRKLSYTNSQLENAGKMMLLIFNAGLKNSGSDWRVGVYESTRPLTRQAKYCYRTQQQTTEAIPSLSPHHYGLALDAVPYDLKWRAKGYTTGWSWERKPDLFQMLGDLAPNYSLKWGGAFTSFKDYPHFERIDWFKGLSDIQKQLIEKVKRILIQLDYPLTCRHVA